MSDKLLDRLLVSLFYLMDLAEDAGLVWSEIRSTYEIAREQGREPTPAERKPIRDRAINRLKNSQKILDRDKAARKSKS